MRNQVLTAQLPLLFHPDPDTVLVIGLGSGVSLGSAETHDLQCVDCVELLDNVVDASLYLREYNYDCLEDPRVNLIIGDGRNHLLLTDRRYDAIISEPTNPWISGVGDLFTYEFFNLAKDRLKAGGLMCAWFQTYHMGERDVRAVVRTFMAVFPEVSLWLVNDSDIILLGAEDAMAFDSNLAERMSVPGVAADLRRIWIRSPADLAASFVAGSGGLVEYAHPAEELHTDDNMMLEFSAGLKVLQTTKAVHLSNFMGIIEPPPGGMVPGDSLEALQTRTEGRRLALAGAVAASEQGIDAAMPLFDRAYALSPSDPYVLHKYVEGRMFIGNTLYAQGDYDGAGSSYLKALVEPDYPLAWRAHLGLGIVQASAGDHEAARRSYELSIAKNPYNPRAYHNLGKLERVVGNVDGAMEAFERALELERDAGVASDLSRIYMELGVNLEKAERLAEQAVYWEASAEHYVTLGWAHNRLGDNRKAEQAMVKAVNLEPGNTEAMFGLATMKLAQGDIDGGRAVLQELVELGKTDVYSKRANQKLRELERR